MPPSPGEPLIHYVKGGGSIYMMHEGVYIYDANGQEIVSWIIDEWKEDIDAVTATLNAISMALEYGVQAVKDRMK